MEKHYFLRRGVINAFFLLAILIICVLNIIVFVFGGVSIPHWSIIVAKFVSLGLLIFSIVLFNYQLKQRIFAEKKSKELQNRLHGILEGTTDMVGALDLNLNYIVINKAYKNEFKKIFGKEIAVGDNLLEVLNHWPQDQGTAVEIWRRALDGERSTIIREFGDSNLERNIYEIAFNSLLDEDGKKIGAAHIVRNVTERTKLEHQLKDSEKRFRTAFNASGIGMALVSLDGKWLRVNRMLCEITGYSEEELLKTDFQSITYPEDLQVDLNYVKQLLAGEIKTYQMEKRYIRKDGSLVWILLTGALVRDENKKPCYFIGQIQDINDRKSLENQLREMAYHDRLTGLVNRAQLEYDVNQLIVRSKRYKGSFAILFLDLDNFKNINDTFGHVVGDELLKVVAKRLKSILRATDIVARLGGDEFVVVLTDVAIPEIIEVIAKKLIKLVQEPITIDEHSTNITASMGISIYPNDAVEYETLLQLADMALYAVKQSGKNNYKFHVPS